MTPSTLSSIWETFCTKYFDSIFFRLAPPSLVQSRRSSVVSPCIQEHSPLCDDPARTVHRPTFERKCGLLSRDLRPAIPEKYGPRPEPHVPHKSILKNFHAWQRSGPAVARQERQRDARPAGAAAIIGRSRPLIYGGHKSRGHNNTHNGGRSSDTLDNASDPDARAFCVPNYDVN